MIEIVQEGTEPIFRVKFGHACELIVIGTAHVSKVSVEQVGDNIIKYSTPPYHLDKIFLELDSKRLKALEDRSFKDINIREILSSGQGYFFMAYLLLSLFQRKIAEETGSEPGGEFKKALVLARERQIPLELIDRPADITLKRCWRSMTVWQQLKLMFGGWSLPLAGGSSGTGAEKLSTAELIETLKERDKMTQMIADLAKPFPTIKRVLLDERDIYMARKIELTLKKAIESLSREAPESPSQENLSSTRALKNTQTTPAKALGKAPEKAPGSPFLGLVVVGAAHVAGMLKYWKHSPLTINSNSRSNSRPSAQSMQGSEDANTYSSTSLDTPTSPTSLNTPKNPNNSNDTLNTPNSSNAPKSSNSPSNNPSSANLSASASPKHAETMDPSRAESVAQLEQLEHVPQVSGFWKGVKRVIPLVIIGVFAWGFYRADWDVLKQAFLAWVIANGVFSALGAIIAGAHPLTILVAIVAAPITSLNPTIGAGLVAAWFEAYIRPPTVHDLETVQLKLSPFTSWWKNQLTRVLLVFVFVSLGSALGTWAALPYLLRIFS